MTGPGDRNIGVGGNASGSIFQTGDNNVANLRYTALPPPETVDIAAVIAGLRAELARLPSGDSDKIARALDDAESELKKPEPDRKEVGEPLSRAIGYAKKAAEFATAADKIAPFVKGAASWLGTEGHALLALIGLTG